MKKGKIHKMIYDLLIGNIYVVMFVGLLFGGETALLPAIYMGISGVISIKVVIVMSILATAISDTFWYFLGRTTPVEKILSLKILRRYCDKIMVLARSFKDNGLTLLFFSKFVYGTRTATQILCGVNKITFTKYFFVNISGILALNVFFLAIGTMVEKSLPLFVEPSQYFWFGIGTFTICAVILQILFKKLIWKKRFQS